MKIALSQCLSALDKGRLGKVTALEFEPSVQQRFEHLGISVGEQIAVVRVSVANSPLMVRINGAYFMIRLQDAQHIQVTVAS